MFGSRIKLALRTAGGSGYFWIFLGALCLRLTYLAEAFQRNELITEPLVDATVYVQWARGFLEGSWLWYDPMNYTPAFPLWLAGWMAVFGPHPGGHFVVFHLLGALQALLLGQTAELLWNRRAGLATGWLAATYWPLIVFEATYYAESFAILNLTLAFYLTTRWSQNAGPVRPLIWAGFSIGWSILARANALLCAPVLAAWGGWRAWQVAGYRRGLRAALALLLPPLLLALPILLWNHRISGSRRGRGRSPAACGAHRN